jgi:uracil-DNA glycosylase family 4
MHPADLARMGWQYAESLKAAGIDWLPRQSELTAAAETPEQPVKKGAPAKASVPLSPPASPTLPASKSDVFQESLGPVLGTQDKRIQLQLMNQKEVKDCPKCPQLVRSRTQTVFGAGNIDTDLFFVGEAPGADEDKQGEPFIGAAGQLLNKILAACGLKREEVFISNVLKCRPPGNRTPMADEVTNCRGYLERQLAIIRPRFICCLGSVAAQTLLNTTVSIGRLRKTMHDYQGMKLVATYHPAYLLRNPAAKKDVWEDMKFLLKAMGRAIP